MEPRFTTPFGRRTLSAGQMAAQILTRDARKIAHRPEGAGNRLGAPVHKWQLLRDLTEARASFGLADRTLAILSALLTFLPETALTLPPAEEESALVVFPSNRELCMRANGVAAATLRRHLACLVEAGLIIRRDSPNGKRYARKDAAGAVSEAFGFDLAPLVARAADIAAAAEAARAEARRLRLERERVTLAKRDLAKLLQALAEAAPDAAAAEGAAVSRLLALETRRLAGQALTEALANIEALAVELSKQLETLAKRKNPSANEADFERHDQNSNSDPHELEPAFEKTGGSADAGLSPGRFERRLACAAEGQGRQADRPSAPAARSVPQSGGGLHELADSRITLGFVLTACPAIKHYAQEHLRGFDDLARLADRLRPMLGISPSAWDEACDVMSRPVAAVLLAAILERVESIRSPGGYLRSLTEKARAGQFSLWPVLMARINR